MSVHVWLRAEDATVPPRGTRVSAAEATIDTRTPLVPSDAGALLQLNQTPNPNHDQHSNTNDRTFRITVEDSPHRVFTAAEYAAVGCRVVPHHTPPPIGDPDLVVLGLRAPAPHRIVPCTPHILFAHAFKGQTHAPALLRRFLHRDASILDLEYLLDDSNTRLASYAPMAGSIGLAGAVIAWCRQILSSTVQIPEDILTKLNRMPLVDHVRGLLDFAVSFHGSKPRIVVIGAKGRCGRGAVAFAQRLGISCDEWTHENTRGKGPFPELLDYEIVVNAIQLRGPMAPFLTHETIRNPTRKLSVLLDFSCDVRNPNNPLPIYNETTTLANPTIRILQTPTPLDVIAIPNFPSLLPAESSSDFSAQLSPLLAQLPNWKSSPIWLRALAFFQQACAPLKPSIQQLSTTDVQQTPASYEQARLFDLELLHQARQNASGADPTKTAAYNIGASYTLQGIPFIAKTKEQWAKALDSLFAQHSVLRTQFSRAPSSSKDSYRIMQNVFPTIDSQNVPLSFDEIASIQDELSSGALFQPFLTTPFILSEQPEIVAWSPLIRFKVITTSAPQDAGRKELLYIVAHKLIADSESLTKLAANLIQLLQDPSSSSLSSTQASFDHQAIAAWEQSQWSQIHATDAEPPEQGIRDRLTADEQVRRTSLGYWTRKLSGSLPVVQLPIDRTRPPVPEFACRHLTKSLAPHTIQGLISLGSQLEPNTPASLTLLHNLLAAASIMLYRYSLEEDLVTLIQSPATIRPEFTRTLGNLTNLLPFRNSIDASTDYASFYNRVASTLEEGLAHVEVPFAKILMEQAVAASEGASFHGFDNHVPMSHIVISFDSQFLGLESRANTKLPDGVSSVQPSFTLSPYDMTIHFGLSHNPTSNTTPSVVISVTYNQNLFIPNRAHEFIAQLELLASQIVLDSTKSVLAYTLVTQEAAKLIPNPRIPLDPTFPGPIYRCFSKQATARPDRVAIFYEGETMIYRDLDLMTNQLANYLISKGIQKEDVIGLYGHRSPAVVWAIMGILKAGAAYTMMDPAYPFDRIAACLDIASIKGWIAIDTAGSPPSELVEFLDAKNLLCQIVLPNPMEVLAGKKENPVKEASSNDPNVDVDENNVAVVTFTSGSTGQPKGVMGRHGPLTHFYPFMAEQFGIGEADRFSMTSGIAHDPLQRDIFTPLYFGAPIFIPTQETILTPGMLAEWMKANDITTACLTPAMGQLLTSNDNPTFTIDSFRAVFFVGDCLIKRDVSRLRKLCPNVRCINMYGSTETQRAVGFYEVSFEQEKYELMKEVVPCGRGMRDAELLVINAAGQLAGIGETSEIFMRSPHLAKGYIGLQEQTNERFFVNPFNKDQSRDRLYKTGDLGRYMPDGNVECIGRADDQVKIRGFRIELGEVNAHLSKHLSVKENVTVVYTDKQGDKKLVSYVVPTEFDANGDRVLGEINSAVLSAELREFLKGKLPTYMVPAAVVIIQAMPLTPNGKINRAALPPPPSAQPKASAQGRQNGDSDSADAHSLHLVNETERKLLRVWSELLERTPTSVDDNFFDLGGHSILATRMNIRLRTEFGHPFPMRLILENPTISQLGKAIDALLAAHSGSNQASDATEAQGKDSGYESDDSEPELDMEDESQLAADFAIPTDLFHKNDPESVQSAKRLKITKQGSSETDNQVASGNLTDAGADDGTYSEEDIARWTNPKGVFLTGATGFLGTFLVRELLDQLPHATVYCHVRAESSAEGLSRVRRGMEACGVWQADFISRIVACVGDLTQPRLGLDDETYATVCSKTDVIVHNGAYVHWLLPYGRVRAANVLGTQAALRIAYTGPIKAFHHVSTTSVLDSRAHRSRALVHEADDLASPRGLHGGYPRSKWVAERMVLRARDRGLPCAVHRPGFVTGALASGVWNTDDFLCRLIKGCVQLRAAPVFTASNATTDASATLDMTPVDRVARYVAALVRSPKALRRVFHHVSPKPLPQRELYAALASFGYPIDFVPYEQWRARLLEAAEAGVENELAPILSHFSDSWGQTRNPIYDRANIVDALTPMNLPLSAPHDTDILTDPVPNALFTYFNYLIRCGFLQAPETGTDIHIDWARIGEGVQQLRRTNRH